MDLQLFQNLGAELEKSLGEITTKCTQCKRCVRDCAFLRRNGDPNELAQKFQNGTLDVKIIFSCSLCQLCTAVCTENIDPNRMLWLMRGWAVAKGQVDYSLFRGILNYERLGFSPLFRLELVTQGCKTLFFPGCATAGSRPHQLMHVIRLLRKQIPDLGVMLNCCGKPSHDLGRLEYFEDKWRSIENRLTVLGIETVLTACPSCHQVFQQYATGVTVKSLYQVIDISGEQQTLSRRKTFVFTIPAPPGSIPKPSVQFEVLPVCWVLTTQK